MGDNPTDRDKLNYRWGALDNEFSSWRTHGMEISDYILPRSGRFMSTDRNRGERKHNNIYDSTGTRALRVLGAGMMGGATSPARPWFRLATADPELMKHAPVKLWLSQVTRLMLDVFQRSNTYRMLHSLYEELGAFGTGASVMMDDFKSVIHNYPLTFGEYRIATDYRQVVNTLYREFDITVGALVGEFVKQADGTMDWSKASITVKNLYDQGSVDAWVTCVHAMEPRLVRDVTKRDQDNMPFKSVYYEKGRDDGDTKYLRVDGMKQFRALCPRWSVSGGDIYGNSPGMEALGDVKQLQHEQLRKAKGIDYQTDPPLQVPTSMKNRDVDRLPGGISFIDMAGGAGSKVSSLFDVQINLSHLLADIQDVRQRIREAFYTDLFLMLSGQDVSKMTATEVAERHEEKLLMLGPVLERLHNELLDPLIDMTFTRLIESGVVPPPPQELVGHDLNVEFVSMLAQAQRAVSTNSVDRFVSNLGIVANIKPGALDKFDEDKWVDSYSDMLGVDPEMIVGSEQVALIRNERMKRQQQANQMAAAQQMAETAKTASQAPTNQPSVLTDVMNQFSGYSTPQGAVQ